MRLDIWFHVEFHGHTEDIACDRRCGWRAEKQECLRRAVYRVRHGETGRPARDRRSIEVGKDGALRCGKTECHRHFHARADSPLAQRFRANTGTECRTYVFRLYQKRLQQSRQRLNAARRELASLEQRVAQAEAASLAESQQLSNTTVDDVLQNIRREPCHCVKRLRLARMEFNRLAGKVTMAVAATEGATP